MLKRIAIFATIATIMSPSYLPQGGSWGQSGQRKPEQPYSHAENHKEVSQPSPAIEDNDSKGSTRETYQNTENGEHAGGKGWTRADRIALFAGISTALQFVALLFTLWLMSRSGRRQLRAYVIPEMGSMANVADPDPAIGPPRQTDARRQYPGWGAIARIQIKNVGQTPAYDVLHWASFDFREYPLNSPLPSMPGGSEKAGHRSPLGPGIPITKTLEHRPLTDDEIKSLKTGTACLYWNGTILYVDVFRKKHFTRYRLMYGIMGGAIGVNTDLSFAAEGNDTDDSKPRYQRWKEFLEWWKKAARE